MTEEPVHDTAGNSIAQEPGNQPGNSRGEKATAECKRKGGEGNDEEGEGDKRGSVSVKTVKAPRKASLNYAAANKQVRTMYVIG